MPEASPTTVLRDFGHRILGSRASSVQFTPSRPRWRGTRRTSPPPFAVRRSRRSRRRIHVWPWDGEREGHHRPPNRSWHVSTKQVMARFDRRQVISIVVAVIDDVVGPLVGTHRKGPVVPVSRSDPTDNAARVRSTDAGHHWIGPHDRGCERPPRGTSGINRCAHHGPVGFLAGVAAHGTAPRPLETSDACSQPVWGWLRAGPTHPRTSAGSLSAGSLGGMRKAGGPLRSRQSSSSSTAPRGG